MPMLQIKALRSHKIGPINLTIQNDERCVISGISGSGKTILLRAIADLDPHQGGIYLDNKSCNSFDPTEWRKLVGMLSAECVWWHDTVEDHFVHIEPCWFTKLGLDLTILKRNINGLSTGERQRLGLLRLLANKPLVLLLDEITSNLDSENTQRIEELIKLYQQENHAIIIWVSHNKEQINRIATRQFILKNGLLTEVT